VKESGAGLDKDARRIVAMVKSVIAIAEV